MKINTTGLKIGFGAMIVGLIVAIGFVRSYLILSTQNTYSLVLEETLISTEKAIDNWVKYHVQEAEIWSGTPELNGPIVALAEKNKNNENIKSAVEIDAVRNLLNKWISTREYRGFMVVSREGDILVSSNSTQIGNRNTAFGDTISLQRAIMGDGFISHPVFDENAPFLNSSSNNNSNLVMYSVSPIFASDGGVIAFLAFALDVHGSFTSILKRGRGGRSIETYAINKSGLMISQSRFHNDLSDIGLLKVGEDSALKIQIRDPGVDLTSIKSPKDYKNQGHLPLTLMARSVIDGNSSHNLEGYNDYRGVKVIGAWSWNDQMQMGVATEIDYDEAFGPFQFFLNIIYTSAGLIIILLVAMAGVILRSNKKLEAENQNVLEAEQYMRLILNSAGNGIFGVNKHGMITFVNPQTCEILGLLEKEAIGKNFDDLILPRGVKGEVLDNQNDPLVASLQDDGVMTLDHGMFRTSSGKDISVRVNSKPIHTGDRLVGRVITFVDRTKEIENQKTLERALKDAEEANQAKSLFLTSMSHELRTPMNAILGFSQILEMDYSGLNETNKDYVREVLKSGYHLLSLIEDVLELSKIDAGEVSMSMEAVDPEQIVDDVLTMTKGMAQKKNISLKNECDFSSGLFVKADFIKAKQIVLNYITNAIKYNSPKGHVVVNMKDLDEPYVRVSVADTGPGIPTNKFKDLWSPFNRIGAENSAIEGTGIGLALTKQLADLMGARVGMSSELGKGSIFWVDFPLGGAGIIEETKAAQKNAQKLADFSKYNGKRILYVEDNVSNQKMLKIMLKAGTKIQLDIAKTGEEAIKKFAKKIPDVVLTDIHLSDITGFQVAEEIRNLEGGKKVPIIVITADISKERREEVRDNHLQGFIDKPIDALVLDKTLARVLKV